MIIRKFLVLAFLGVSLMSCKESDQYNPELSELLFEFSFSINLQDPKYQPLQLPNNFVYVDGGVNGIVLLSTNFGEINAYERNCTYTPKAECAKISMHPSRIFFWDSCCSSQFELNGLVKESPATKPMVQYSTNLQGNDLYISYP